MRYKVSFWRRIATHRESFAVIVDAENEREAEDKAARQAIKNPHNIGDFMVTITPYNPPTIPKR